MRAEGPRAGTGNGRQRYSSCAATHNVRAEKFSGCTGTRNTEPHCASLRSSSPAPLLHERAALAKVLAAAQL
eukprot:4144282-Alexandrium_andersonii.AAC.1